MKCEYINTVKVRRKKKVKITLSLAVFLGQPQPLDKALTGELVCDSTGDFHCHPTWQDPLRCSLDTALLQIDAV